MLLKFPSVGGETGFCDMYQALESLPTELRRAIDGKTLKHEKFTAATAQSAPGLKTQAPTTFEKFRARSTR